MLNIYHYITFLQNKLSAKGYCRSIEDNDKLQKVFEYYLKNHKPKEKFEHGDADKLHNLLIPLFASTQKEQEELIANFKEWYALSQIEEKKEAITKEETIRYFGLFLLCSLVIYALFFHEGNADIEDKGLQIIKEEFFFKDTVQLNEGDTIKATFSLKAPGSIDSVSLDSVQWSTVDSFSFRNRISRPSSILFADTSHLGVFKIVGQNAGLDSLRVFFKPKYTVAKSDTVIIDSVSINTWYVQVNREEVEISATTFPVMGYQAYPYQDRTLKAIEENPSNEKTFIGKYKVPLALLIGLLFYLLSRRKDAEVEKVEIKGPYYQKLTIPNRVKIKLGPSVHQGLHKLRKSIFLGSRKLDVKKTINKSIKNAGYVDFEYRHISHKTEYLFLIHHHAQADHRAQMWQDITEELKSNDLSITTFHFNADLRACYNKKFSKGINLKQLYNLFPNSILVIVGGETNLINPKTGHLSDWTLILNEWHTRYLLTWKNYLKWDKREEKIKSLFHLLPAKSSSIPELWQRPNDAERFNYSASWEEHLVNYQMEFEVNSIKSSFSKVQQDWIAASCLFPMLHYDLSLELGNIVYNHHGKDFNIEEIEKVFPISWFCEGLIPDEVRIALSTELETQPELLAKLRQFIYRDLKNSRPPKNSHADERFNEGLLINEYLDKGSPPAAKRKQKIENELAQIYERGLDHDVQISNQLTAKGEFKGTIQERVTSFMEDWTVPLTIFIISLIAFSDFFKQEDCNIKYVLNSTFALNYDLSNYEAGSEIVSKKDFCASTIENADEIVDENGYRKMIYQNDYAGLSRLITEEASNELKLNIAVDLINLGIRESAELQGRELDEIKGNVNDYPKCIQVCDDFRLANEYSAFSDFVFRDSLDLLLNWCYLLVEDSSSPTIGLSIRNFTDKEKRNINSTIRSLGFKINPVSQEVAKANRVSDLFELYYGQESHQQALELQALILKKYDLELNLIEDAKQVFMEGSDFILILNGQSTNQNPCDNIDCINGGNCADGICECPPAYAGARCEIGPLSIGVSQLNYDAANFSPIRKLLFGEKKLSNDSWEDLEQRPSYLALESSLFYYTNDLKTYAENLAEELQSIIGESLVVKRGAGNLANSTNFPNTFRLHLIGKNQPAQTTQTTQTEQTAQTQKPEDPDGPLCEFLLVDLMDLLAKSANTYSRYTEDQLYPFEEAQLLWNYNKEIAGALESGNFMLTTANGAADELMAYFENWSSPFVLEKAKNPDLTKPNLFTAIFQYSTFPIAARNELEQLYNESCFSIDATKYPRVTLPEMQVDNSSTRYNLTGVVFNEGTGEPVQNAEVQVKGTTIKVATDAAGNYTFNNLTSLPKTIVVSAANYTTDELIVRDLIISNEGIDISLSQIYLAEEVKDGFIRGVVYDANTNAPIAGATLNIPGTQIQGSTNTSGYFRLNTSRFPISEGQIINVRHPGYNSIETKFLESETNGLEIYLQPIEKLNSIRGYIYADAKKKNPIAGAAIVLDGTPLRALSDMDGYFKLDNLSEKNTTIEVSYLGYENYILVFRDEKTGLIMNDGKFEIFLDQGQRKK